MEKPTPKKKVNWEQVSLITLAALGLIFLFILIFFLTGGNRPNSKHTTTSDLINTKEIATLSVSEFVYNGIARTYKDNGDPDYNVLYNSTIKVSVDAEKIDYVVDEENRTVLFIFPKIEVGTPVIDIDSLKTIPDRNDLFIDEVIRLCRNDALEEANKSEKLITSAQENLKSVMEAWYSPVFVGYTFEYQFGTPEGGEA